MHEISFKHRIFFTFELFLFKMYTVIINAFQMIIKYHIFLLKLTCLIYSNWLSFQKMEQSRKSKCSYRSCTWCCFCSQPWKISSFTSYSIKRFENNKSHTLWVSGISWWDTSILYLRWTTYYSNYQNESTIL